MKYPIKRDATGMRASYKRSDFGEMKRGQFLEFARAALIHNTATESLTAPPAVDTDTEGMLTSNGEAAR